MNITLISPSMYIAAPGIRMISACLKRAGHQTKIIFVKTGVGKECDDKTLDLIIELTRGANLVGFSLTTNFFDISAQITKRIKQELRVPVIWGGIHPTVKPEECLEYADIVCRGEGEGAIVELAEKIKNGENYFAIQNLCFKNRNGNIVKNPIRPIIQDLDSLPFLDYDLQNHYIVANEKSYRMDDPDVIQFWDGFSYNGYSHTYTTLITRGCPFSCAYCCNNTLNKIYHGQKIFRVRSIDNVIEELKIAKEKLPFAGCIFLNDDYLLGLPLEYIKEFSVKYKKYINLPLIIVGVHPSAVEEQKLKYITDATTVAFLAMGIQVASERMKKLFRRDYPNSHVIRAAKIINKFKNKIKIVCFEVIVDSPWQTEKDSIETLMLLSKLPTPYTLNVFSLIFYPGTELYDLAKKDGLVHDEKRDIYQKNYLLDYQSTYLNKLFFLIKDYSFKGLRISPFLMFLLTNNFFRKMKLNLPLYSFLYSYSSGGVIYKLTYPVRTPIKHILKKGKKL